MILWLQFITCSALIMYAGTKLTIYGDIIAEKTGLSKTWIGVVLMASVTSLPELITGVSSVTLFDLPEIAAGDVLGSCMFNMLIIALLDILHGPSPVSASAHQGHVLTGAFGILLLGLVSLSIFAASNIPSLGWISLSSFAVAAIYLAAMRMIFAYEKRQVAEFVKDIVREPEFKNISKSTAFLMYGVNAAVIIAAATYLPHLGESIAQRTGLGQTFVGNIFIALSTSLPEVVVSISALKIGAVDLAFGNIFGSNVFNIFILALDDIFYTKGPLLTDVSQIHIVTAITAMMMTAIASIGLTYRTSKKHLFIAWDALGIVILYVVATAILYVKS